MLSLHPFEATIVLFTAADLNILFTIVRAYTSEKILENHQTHWTSTSTVH